MTFRRADQAGDISPGLVCGPLVTTSGLAYCALAGRAEAASTTAAASAKLVAVFTIMAITSSRCHRQRKREQRKISSPGGTRLQGVGETVALSIVWSRPNWTFCGHDAAG